MRTACRIWARRHLQLNSQCLREKRCRQLAFTLLTCGCVLEAGTTSYNAAVCACEKGDQWEKVGASWNLLHRLLCCTGCLREESPLAAATTLIDLLVQSALAANADNHNAGTDSGCYAMAVVVCNGMTGSGGLSWCAACRVVRCMGLASVSNARRKGFPWQFAIALLISKRSSESQHHRLRCGCWRLLQI